MDDHNEEERLKALEAKAEELFKDSTRAIAVFKDKKKEVHLAHTSGGKELMILTSRTRGYTFRNMSSMGNAVLDIVPIDYRARWEHTINKVIRLLEQSGFWADVLKNAKIARDVGYDKLHQAMKADELHDSTLSYEANHQKRAEAIKAIDERLTYMAEGKLCVNVEILWHLAHRELKVKKMYFGDANEAHLAEIKEGIKKGLPFSVIGYSSYDVSFEFKPEDKKAWYSEEFKGCGNGHYYLALDDTYALHYEDD